MSQHGSMTPEEVEVGRRNLIAELQAGVAQLEYDGQWCIDLKTVRGLIAVLEAPLPTPVVTQSAEIPEEAVEAATDVLDEHGHNGLDCRPRAGFDLSVRAALAGALPYLTPAAFARGAAAEHQVGHLRIPMEGCVDCQRATPRTITDEAIEAARARLDEYYDFEVRGTDVAAKLALEAAVPHLQVQAGKSVLVAEREGENALAPWLEEVFSTDEDTITWEQAADALFELGAVREVRVDREALVAAVGGHDSRQRYDGPVMTWYCTCGAWSSTSPHAAVTKQAEHIADLVLALLSPEETK